MGIRHLLRSSLTVRAGAILGAALATRALIGLVQRFAGDWALSPDTASALRGACDLVVALAIPAVLVGIRRALGLAGKREHP